MTQFPNRPSALQNFRSAASSLLNRNLNRFGYALVRPKRGGIQTTFTEHLDVRFAYEDIILMDTYAPWATDEKFMEIWNQIQNYTLIDIYRGFELYDLVRQNAHVDGDVLEVGVWRGGSGALLAGAAQRWKPNAKVWLCDTFSGVVKAGVYDPSYSGGEHADTTCEIVVDLLAKLDFSNVGVLAGSFPTETGHLLDNRTIGFCHIDVDVYQSAADIMKWLLPRMSRDAIVVFDDYGFSTCKGITRLVDEICSNGDWIFIYNLNKHAILVRR